MHNSPHNEKNKKGIVDILFNELHSSQLISNKPKTNFNV